LFPTRWYYFEARSTKNLLDAVAKLPLSAAKGALNWI
jgi:hypothetical protein